MLRRIARSSMDRLAGFLRNPDGPAEPDTTAVAESEPEPPRRPQRRSPRSAAAPSAAEQLALSASR
jgi:hypothetical protein